MSVTSRAPPSASKGALVAVFIVIIGTVIGGLVLYAITNKPEVGYSVSIQTSYSSCPSPPQSIATNGQSTLTVLLCFRNAGGITILVDSTLSVNGATILCGNTNQTSCGWVGTVLDKGSMSYGSLRATLVLPRDAKSFTLTISTSTHFDVLSLDSWLSFFADVRGFPISVTYTQSSPGVFTLTSQF